MVQKFLNMIHYLSPATGFEAYVKAVLSSGRTDMPTIDEAKRDYFKVHGSSRRP